MEIDFLKIAQEWSDITKVEIPDVNNEEQRLVLTEILHRNIDDDELIDGMIKVLLGVDLSSDDNFY